MFIVPYHILRFMSNMPWISILLMEITSIWWIRNMDSSIWLLPFVELLQSLCILIFWHNLMPFYQSPSFKFTSALVLISTLTTSKWPLWEAAINGVDQTAKTKHKYSYPIYLSHFVSKFVDIVASFYNYKLFTIDQVYLTNIISWYVCI